MIAGRSAGKFDVLSKIALPIDLTVNNQRLFDDMQRNVHTLASLWGKQAEGQQLMQRACRSGQYPRYRAAKGRGPGAGGQQKYERPDTGIAFGLLYDVLGVKPTLPADPSKPRGVPLKMDDIAKINPSWLYVIDRNAGTGSTTDRDGKPWCRARSCLTTTRSRTPRLARKARWCFWTLESGTC